MRTYSLLDSIIDNQAGGGGPVILGEQHNPSAINFVAGLSDPGEMIRCGYLPEIRRQAGETDDAAYAARILPIVMALPVEQRDVIMGAAIKRASLDTSNGRVAMMAAGVLPWHGLGVLVKDAVTSADAIRLAGLDWQVLKTALSYTFNGETKDAPDAFGIVREDTGDWLGSVGSRYKCIQNRDGFSFLDAVLEQYGAKYETAGSLRGGRKVWMLARMPQQSFTLGKGDTVESYALFTTAHDGSEAAFCFPTTNRVVCNNTFRMAAKDRKNGISIRHTGSVKAKIGDAQAALGLAVKGLDSFHQAAEAMSGKRLEVRPYAAGLLDDMIGLSEARKALVGDLIAADREKAEKDVERKAEQHAACLADVLERYEGDACGLAERGTAWAAFNAVTEHADHNTLGRQAKDLNERRTRRFESTLNGPADELKQLAYVRAMA